MVVGVGWGCQRRMVDVVVVGGGVSKENGRCGGGGGVSKENGRCGSGGCRRRMVDVVVGGGGDVEGEWSMW